MRKKRTITKEEKDMFLALKPNDITMEKFNELFMDTIDHNKQVKDSDTGVMIPAMIPSKFNTFDEFELKAHEYFNNTTVTTNCGLFIFNKFLLEPAFSEITGYINFEITGKGLDRLNDIIVTAVLLDETGELTPPYIEYLNRLAWLAFSVNTQICSSLNVQTSTMLPEVRALKKKLLTQYKAEIEAGDVVTYVKIQEELVKEATKVLKDDPALELYLSGARGSMDNAYRQWLCTKGPVWNENSGKFEIITNSLDEGIPKEALPALSNAVVSNFYSKSIAPGDSGYVTKKLSAAFQDVVLDEPGSDCGTKICSKVTLTDFNIDLYMYNYIKESNGKYTRLEPKNKDKYLGKTVFIRTPDYCIGDKKCNRCCGDRFYLMGLDNVGLTFGRISNSMLRAKFKVSHDSTVRLFTLKPEDFLVEYE